MYWKQQEKVIFAIILIMLWIFHISSAWAIWSSGTITSIEGVLIMLNLAGSVALIFYAQWVWKPITLFQACCKVVHYNGMCLLLVGMVCALRYMIHV
jgi:hypothetical protein